MTLQGTGLSPAWSTREENSFLRSPGFYIDKMHFTSTAPTHFFWETEKYFQRWKFFSRRRNFSRGPKAACAPLSCRPARES